MGHRGPLLLDPSNTIMRPKYFDERMTRFMVGEQKISSNGLAECGNGTAFPRLACGALKGQNHASFTIIFEYKSVRKLRFFMDN